MLKMGIKMLRLACGIPMSVARPSDHQSNLKAGHSQHECVLIPSGKFAHQQQARCGTGVHLQWSVMRSAKCLLMDAACVMMHKKHACLMHMKVGQEDLMLTNRLLHLEARCNSF